MNIFIIKKDGEYYPASSLQTVSDFLNVSINTLRYQMKKKDRYACNDYEIIKRPLMKDKRGGERKKSAIGNDF